MCPQVVLVPCSGTMILGEVLVAYWLANNVFALLTSNLWSVVTSAVAYWLAHNVCALMTSKLWSLGAGAVAHWLVLAIYALLMSNLWSQGGSVVAYWPVFYCLCLTVESFVITGWNGGGLLPMVYNLLTSKILSQGVGVVTYLPVLIVYVLLTIDLRWLGRSVVITGKRQSVSKKREYHLWSVR